MNADIKLLMEKMAGFQEASILGAMAELDLCTTILKNENSISLLKLSKKTKLDIRRLSFLLDALAGSAYLEKSGIGEDALYSVNKAFKDYLDSRNPLTMIPYLRHLSSMQRSWTQLARVVLDGQEAAIKQPSILGTEEDRVSFLMAMNSIALTRIDKMVEELIKAKILPDKEEECNFIDIGGASGTYTWAFLEALPKSKGTLFDLPGGIKTAEKRFISSPYEKRVKLVQGDFSRDLLPQGFDFAWLSAIIHQQGREESRKLYANIFQSLKSGAKLAIRDFIMNENRTQPKAGTFFGINMLVQTATGMVYTFKEVEEDLKAEGFTKIKHAIKAESMFAVVTAEKP